MNLDQIAAEMRLTREQLVKTKFPKRSHEDLTRSRREFIARAFSEGFEVLDICEYIERRESTVTHALRMVCMNRHRAPYGSSPTQMRKILRVAA